MLVYNIVIYKVLDQWQSRLELFRLGWVRLGWGGKHVVVMLASPAELGLGLSLAILKNVSMPVLRQNLSLAK